MTATTGKLLPVGTRFVNVWELTALGFPKATSPTIPYTGIQAEGGKQLQLTVPEPRKITHAGDDRPLAVDFLPPLEAATGELHVAKTNYTLQAILAGVKQSTIGESVGILYATNKQGLEPNVALQIYQQALDASGTPGVRGSRRWRNIWIPQARVILSPHGTDDNAADLTYRLAPFVVAAHLWGTAFTDTLDGAIESQFSERMTEGLQTLDTWCADGTTTVYTLSHAALSVGKIAVFRNGTLITTGTTITTASVTFTAPPSNDDIVAVLYEY